MRRYLLLVVLFVVTLPVQLSIVGCGTNPNNYCNAFGAGFATKKGTLVSFTLDPQQTGISLAFGKVGNLNAGGGKDCAGAPANLGTLTYGTSDLNNVDVSPTGQVCAGRWNRTSSSGVAAYSTCIPTNVSEVATASASSGGVTSSNAVKIYVHPVVTDITLDTLDASGKPVQGCLSQFQTAQLNATAFVNQNGQNTLFCAPAGNPQGVPDCSTNIGNLSYAAQTTSANAGTTTSNTVVSIDPTGVATAKQPGAAVITASISGTSSGAGYFYTCPPASITLQANGTSSNVTVQPNLAQPTTATVIDTKGATITGVPLTYTSTDQRTIGVSGTGSITSRFAGSSSVYAVCAPPSCNPAPVNQIGVNGNGVPVASNTLNVTSPGSASSLIWMASPNSQYFTAIDLSQNTSGSPVHLPYKPNSMVLDQTGSSLYFGSYRELMIVNATSTVGGGVSSIAEDTTVKGVVLAVSPSNNEVVINDQDQQILYLYRPATASSTTGGTGSAGTSGTPASIVTQYGGVGQRAVFSPDGTTVYIVGTNKLYIFNTFTGWSTESLDPSNATPSSGVCPANTGSDPNVGGPANAAYNVFCSPDVALAVPQFGAFLSGANTTARGYCPDTRTGAIDNYPSAVPGGATGYGFAADHLATTTNGKHVVSATANPAELVDANVVVPTEASANAAGACPTSTNTVNGATVTSTIPLEIANPNNFTQSLAAFAPSLIHQVVTSPDSSLAVVTYEQANPTAGNALLPVYRIPAAGVAGALTPVKLTGAQATTPVAAIFSPDYSQIFVSTGGDANMHIVSTRDLTDTVQFNPNLPDGNGGITPAQFLAVKPRAVP